jgi:CDP-4-dehydro-6-deoxyglucose reductase, E1
MSDPQGINLIKSTFFEEEKTKEKLIDFIRNASKLSMGKEVKKFEELFAAKQQKKYAVFVSSGSAANLVLIQSVLNLGQLKPGDRVGVSALTWATNVMPLIQLGLEPVILDCEMETLNVSVEKIKEIHTNEPLDGLFLTNVLGFADHIDVIKGFCSDQGILFLEDNCESLGSSVKGTLLGNFGKASTFSFFVGHHLSTIEGGMICTDDEELYSMLLGVRAHGWDRNLSADKKKELRDEHDIDDFYSRYTFYDLAYNARGTDIQGFIGTTQIGYWDKIVSKREENFNHIFAVVNKNDDFYPLNVEHMDIVSNFAFPIIARTKKIFLKYKKRFEEENIEIRPIIAGNIARQPFFKKYFEDKMDTIKAPNSETIHTQGFYFGNNPELTQAEIEKVVSLLKN